jgi:hypothetical protein
MDWFGPDCCSPEGSEHDSNPMRGLAACPQQWSSAASARSTHTSYEAPPIKTMTMNNTIPPNRRSIPAATGGDDDDDDDDEAVAVGHHCENLIWYLFHLETEEPRNAFRTKGPLQCGRWQQQWR